jgi:hypothetical protein
VPVITSLPAPPSILPIPTRVVEDRSSVSAAVVPAMVTPVKPLAVMVSTPTIERRLMIWLLAVAFRTSLPRPPA